jgi:C-terminal processing protease CtpA/Prc
MFTLPFRLSLLTAVAGWAIAHAPGQPPSTADRTIDAAERTAVIDGVLEKVVANYVFPDVGKKMEVAIRDRVAKKEYDNITSGRELARVLTENLREVCKDKHLGVRLSPQALPPVFSQSASPAEEKKVRESMALRNFGFKKVERLGNGGVGLLELEGFLPAEMIGETAAAAMGFLAGNDAVIIDLRKNGGGSPDAVILLCSYFFDEATHLNSIYTRGTDSTKQYWSHPVVPGKKLSGKDVYVLTSNRTFSAAEEFTYNMQSQKRATIVGETTGGGAHPTRGFRINDHFSIGVPFARSINPVTKTNWEGTGVKPDVAVPADKALATAHMMALEKAASKYADDKEKSAAIKREIETLKKETGEKVAGGDGHKPMQIASKFSLGVKLAIDDGSVRIDEVIEGSAAARDGLKNGDLLLKANGKALDGELIGTLLQTGDPISFELTRDGKTMTVKVKPNPR